MIAMMSATTQAERLICNWCSQRLWRLKEIRTSYMQNRKKRQGSDAVVISSRDEYIW